MDNKISLFDLLKQAENAKVSVSDKAKLYSDVLVQKSITNRRPLAIQLELLPVCNFNCKVCYIRMTFDEVKQSGQRVLRFEDWKYYIDAAAELGVYSITFTGGECTIHPDFIQIYQYAYQKGIQVGMISNGSSITPEIMDLFENCPPTKVYITLYGMSNDTYERFCGVRAFDKVMRNIDALRSKKINVILNFTVGKENLYDLEKALRFARDNQIAIFPNNSLQVSRKFTTEALEREGADYYLYEKLEHEHLSKYYHMSFEEFENGFLGDVSIPYFDEQTKGLHCNAGRCMFTVNWKGEMQPCASIYWYTQNPHEVGGIEQAWENLVAWADEVPALEDCKTCIFQHKCRLCVALHYCDMGEYGKVSPRFCFKALHPKEAAKLQTEYDRGQVLKKTEESAQ
ncbi:MAG: radical SAM protein [Ruminococcus sp.]|nr:radical SAM protein [Ruminococcus sp.]